MSKGRRNKQNKRRREKRERRAYAVSQQTFVRESYDNTEREGTHVQDVKKPSRLLDGLKAFGGFVWRMFFRVRLLVAFPFLLVGMGLVIPKDFPEFCEECWEMFKQGHVC